LGSYEKLIIPKSSYTNFKLPISPGGIPVVADTSPYGAPALISGEVPSLL